MAELLRHRQTKEAATDMFTLQPPRHIPTLPFASVELSWNVGFTPNSGRIAARQRTDASGHYRPFRRSAVRAVARAAGIIGGKSYLTERRRVRVEPRFVVAKLRFLPACDGEIGARREKAICRVLCFVGLPIVLIRDHQSARPKPGCERCKLQRPQSRQRVAPTGDRHCPKYRDKRPDSLD
jgi:hypothetical protein